MKVRDKSLKDEVSRPRYNEYDQGDGLYRLGVVINRFKREQTWFKVEDVQKKRRNLSSYTIDHIL